MADAAADGYLEINLSPAGKWAAYRFSGYREDMENAADVTLDHLESGASDHLCLNASIGCEIPDHLRLMPACVLSTPGGLRYFAPAHPADSDRPDFHDAECHVIASVDDL